jgi:hypothetical protein
MSEDLEHLERHLHSVVAIARTLARDADAVDGELWNEPYAYQASRAAISALRNLRRQLESRWLVTPLESERPTKDSDDPEKQLSPDEKVYPRVTSAGVRRS